MIKKPIFYPVLPRERHGKHVKFASSSTATTPIRSNRDATADRYIKSTGTYVPNVIDSHSVTTVGNDQRAKTNNPNWRQTVAKGGDATSTYERTVLFYKAPTYRVVSEDLGNRSVGYGQYDGGFTYLLNSWTPLDDRAAASLKRKLAGNIGNAKLLPPLVESREIHRLVRQINGLTMDTLKALLAIKKTRGKSAFKQFGNIWLGFGFGVNPMLKDIESAANSILDYTMRENRRVVVSGTASSDYFSSGKALTPQQIAWGCSMGIVSSYAHTQSVRIKAGIDLKMRTAASYSVLDHLGLKVSELPSALWELTPYSWAVDYFTTVGPWLDDVFYTLPGVTVFVSRNRKYQCDITHLPYPVPNAGFTADMTYTVGKGRYVDFTRDKLAALPTRSLEIKSFDEIANHGLTKILNLASILAQRWGPHI